MTKKKTLSDPRSKDSYRKHSSKLLPDGMTVGQLIKELRRYPLNKPVNITDGYSGVVYDRLKLACIHLFEDTDGSTAVDIGIGGCHHIEEEED